MCARQNRRFANWEGLSEEILDMGGYLKTVKPYLLLVGGGGGGGGVCSPVKT